MSGLQDVIAFDTEISHIDGEAGRLLIRGQPIQAVCRLGFERAAALLLFDDDSPGRADTLGHALGTARTRTYAERGTWETALASGSPMAGMRSALARLDLEDDASVIGAFGVLLAARGRLEAGEVPCPPDASAPHAADVLRMMRGPVSAPEVDALDAYLCTIMEHGVNASTFAARVVASTDAGTLPAVIAGLCALEGRLHGGAPGPVLDMLDAIEAPAAARAWLEHELEAGRRIMGMGHRVYRARDPRAAVLEEACRHLDGDTADRRRILLARAVEAEAERLLAERHPDRPLRANVEFFTAILLEALAMPRHMFTATFAAGRVVGWCAHVAEQRRLGRLIRPRARYVGRAS
jgi:citrate synthase